MSINTSPNAAGENAAVGVSATTLTSRFNNFVWRYIAELKKYRVLRHSQQISRQAFDRMLALDDRTLADIGVTRDDVLWASKLPLSANAAQELQKISQWQRR